MEYPEETMKDLEEIYRKVSAMKLLPVEHSEVNKLIFSTFQAGIDRALSADPLEGYSNLTAAISAGELIDWEKLDGLKVKCVNRHVGTLRGVLMRNRRLKPDTSDAWWDEEATASYINALYDGWSGKDGWSLWVEGEIPMRRKTADQLEVAHFFTGVLSGTTSECLMCVAGGLRNGKHVRYAFDFMPSHHPAEKWEVIEEHGPFQKPEGK